MGDWELRSLEDLNQWDGKCLWFKSRTLGGRLQRCSRRLRRNDYERDVLLHQCQRDIERGIRPSRPNLTRLATFLCCPANHRMDGNSRTLASLWIERWDVDRHAEALQRPNEALEEEQPILPSIEYDDETLVTPSPASTETVAPVTPTMTSRPSFDDSGFFSRAQSPASRIADPETPSRLGRTNSARIQNDFLTSGLVTQSNPETPLASPSSSASLPQPSFGSTFENPSYSNRTNLDRAQNGFLESTAAIAQSSIETDRVDPFASTSLPPLYAAGSSNPSSLPQSSRYYLPYKVLTPQEISQALLDEVKRDLLPTEVDRRTIYGFRESADSEFIKIGVATNFDQRMRELGTKCGYQVGPPVFRFEVNHAGRVERLLQRYFAAERRIEDVTRRATPPSCQHHSHIEWFQISDERAKAVAERWRSWMETKPYYNWDHPLYKMLRIRWRLKLNEFATETMDEDHWAKFLEPEPIVEIEEFEQATDSDAVRGLGNFPAQVPVAIAIPEPIAEVETFEQAADSDAIRELEDFPAQVPVAIAIPEPIVEVETFEQAVDSGAVGELGDFPAQIPVPISIPAIIPGPTAEIQSPILATEVTEGISHQAQLPTAIVVPSETETCSSLAFVFDTHTPFSFQPVEPRAHIPPSVSVETQSSCSLAHDQIDISPSASSNDLGLTLPALVHLSFRVAQFLLILCIFGNMSYSQFTSISILALATFSFSNNQNIGFFPTNPLKVMDLNHDLTDVTEKFAPSLTEPAKNLGAEVENSDAARKKQEETLYPDAARVAAEAAILTRHSEPSRLSAQEMREINVMLRDLVAEMAGQGRRRPASWSGP